jgi:hypothetical protein
MKFLQSSITPFLYFNILTGKDKLMHYKKQTIDYFYL